MDSADRKGSTNTGHGTSKKIDSSELSSSKRIDNNNNDNKHSIDEDIKDVFEKGTDDSENETLSRNHPLSEFIKENKGILKGLSQAEFKAKYNEFMKGKEDRGAKNVPPANRKEDLHTVDSQDAIEDETKEGATGSDFLDRIVLKFTTLSETNSEAPSFTVGSRGAKIGRDTTNEVCVPSDTRLAAKGHSFIEHSEGSFYLVDGGFDFSASIRISVGTKKKPEWVCFENTRFSAGNSVFEAKGISPDGCLVLEIIEGPLKGERRLIPKKGATLGRSSDNVISIPDRELSRRHSKVEYDEAVQKFCVCDIGSTNGTYMQLVGPYAGKYKLCINDHILVGRTGFSINRYDYGLSEEMGYRQSMEDSCTILQNMDVPALAAQDLAPQSFFGVFDGHGGQHASLYLSQHLHVNVGNALTTCSAELKRLLQSAKHGGALNDAHPLKDEVDRVVISALEAAFAKTDAEFIGSSPHSQNGSTATTALVLGKRLYCANTGDSRTFLCRNFKPVRMTEDHKPSREDEQKRIRDAGGFVINNRVMGELAVSRAFGDAEFKKGIQSIIDEEGVKMPPNGKSDPGDDGQKNWDQPLIICTPDVQVTTITDHDQFLLLACDGLFDVFTEEEVVEFVKEKLEETGDPQKCCEALTDDAINNRNSRDNVSVILIILNKWY